MTNKKFEERLGTEKMLPLLFRMAMPAVAAQLINLLYSIVDRIYIGHIPNIGRDALAGIGVTSSIIMLITAFSAIVGVGAAPLASIALGKGDRKRAELILGNGAMLLLIFTIVLSLICYPFMEPILLATGASQKTLPYAVDYLSIYLIGTLFVQISTGLNSFINVQGRPSIAMMAVVLGALLNIMLDPLFIFVIDMGVSGAAYATLISQAFSAIWIIGFLLSKQATLTLQPQYFKLQRKIVGATFALGISPFIMSSTEAVVGFVLNGSLKHYGDIHISAMAVIQSALLCASVPLTGFSQGFMPIVSYNFGHGNNERVKECFKYSLIAMALFNFVLILSIILFPRLVASAFTSDTKLLDLVSHVMPIFFIGMTLFGLQRCCQSMFVALGQAKISVFIAILRKGILLIPLALILPRYFDEMGIYYSEAISDGVAALICTTIFMFLFPRILQRGI